MIEVIGLPKFEALFRKVASLDVDKQDIKRMNELINQKIIDLIVVAEGVAKANGRDIIQYHDLSITKGIQEHMNEFKKYDYHLDLTPSLERITAIPQMNLACSKEVEEELSILAGALIIMMAKIFKVIDPDLKNPVTEDWEKVKKIFDIIL
jgi:histone H3/H4